MYSLGGWMADGWMAYAWVLVVHRHSRALMCLWVSLLGRVWSHASVASDPHRFRRVLLAGSCGYLYTPHTLSHLGTPDVILPITPTHRDVSTHMVQGGHHPNAWTRGGDWHVLLSLAVVAVAGGGISCTGLGTRPPFRPMGAPGPCTDSARGSSNSSGNPRNAGSGWGLWQAVVVLRIAGVLWVGWSSYMYSLTIRDISIYQMYTTHQSLVKYTHIHWFTIDDGRCTYTGSNRTHTHTVCSTLSHMTYIYI